MSNEQIQSRTNTNKYMWFALALASTTQAAGAFASQGLYALIPFLKEDFELSQTQAGLTSSALNFGQILAMLYFGRAIDKYGERVVVGVSLIGMLAIGLLGALSPSYSVLLLLIAVLGALYSSVQPGGTRLIIRWFPPAKRGLAIGIRQTALPLGTMMALMLIPRIAETFGWVHGFLILGVVGAVGGGLFLTLYRESTLKQSTPSKNLGEKQQAPKNLSTAQLLSHLYGDKYIRAWIFAGMTLFAFQGAIFAHVILYMIANFRLDAVSAAQIFTVTQIIGIPARIIIPWLGDKYFPGRRVATLTMLLLLSAISVGILTVLPSHGSLSILVLLMILLGLALSWFPTYLIELSECAPQHAIASTVAISSSLGMGAMISAPVVFGWMVDLFGYQVAWLALALVPLIASIILIKYRTSK